MPSSRVDLREVHVTSAECGSDADALLETCHRLISPLRAQIKDTQIVQGLRVAWSELQCLLQKFVSPIAVTGLSEDHAQTVICLRIVGFHFQSSLQRLASLIPILQLPVRSSQIVESNQVVWIQPQGFLKIRYRLRHLSLACGQNPQVVPGIGQSIWDSWS